MKDTLDEESRQALIKYRMERAMIPRMKPSCWQMKPFIMLQ